MYLSYTIYIDHQNFEFDKSCTHDSRIILNFSPQITTFQFSMYILGIDLQFLHLTLHMIGPCQFVYNINNVNNVKYVQIADNAGNLSFINLSYDE